jgi:hypothetical protein
MRNKMEDNGTHTKKLVEIFRLISDTVNESCETHFSAVSKTGKQYTPCAGVALKTGYVRIQTAMLNDVRSDFTGINISKSTGDASFTLKVSCISPSDPECLAENVRVVNATVNAQLEKITAGINKFKGSVDKFKTLP